MYEVFNVALVNQLNKEPKMATRKCGRGKNEQNGGIYEKLCSYNRQNLHEK